MPDGLLISLVALAVCGCGAASPAVSRATPRATVRPATAADLEFQKTIGVDLLSLIDANVLTSLCANPIPDDSQCQLLVAEGQKRVAAVNRDIADLGDPSALAQRTAAALVAVDATLAAVGSAPPDSPVARTRAITANEAALSAVRRALAAQP